MANEEQSKDRRSYSVPEIQVHGDVRLVTRALQMGTGGSDTMGQGNQNFKTSP